MENQKNKRFYSPQFSELAAVSVRRFAWALGGNMVQAVDAIVSCLLGFIKTDKVCQACKDNTKCAVCVFKSGAELQESVTAFLYQ